MSNINPQHKSFLWHLDFEPFTWHTFYGEQCPPFVTEENKEAWRRYLTKVIKKHLKGEVMNTPEFKGSGDRYEVNPAPVEQTTDVFFRPQIGTD